MGITGVGYEIGIAGMHIQAYKLMDDASITAVYDVQPGRAQEYIDRFGLQGAVACTSYQQLLQLVDAVTICTPNDSHVELSAEALAAGRHVLCEKPFAQSAAHCAELTAQAAKSDKISMIGLCYRGIPAYRMLKKLVEAGELGEIFYTRQSMGGDRIANPEVKLEWRMQKDRSGPGAMADFGSHMLDMNEWIVGNTCGAIQQVTCQSGTFINTRARQDNGQPGAVTNDDVAQFTAKTAKGVLCSFNASRVGGQHTFEVFGSKGTAAFTDDPFALTLTRKLEGKPVTERVPADEACYLGAPEQARKPFLINFYQQNREFLDLIQNGGKTDRDFARGLYVQRLIDAVQRAADEGRTVQPES